MSNKELVKIKTEKARINGLPPYLKAFRGHALPILFITQTVLLASRTETCPSRRSVIDEDMRSREKARIWILIPVLVYPH